MKPKTYHNVQGAPAAPSQAESIEAVPSSTEFPAKDAIPNAFLDPTQKWQEFFKALAVIAGDRVATYHNVQGAPAAPSQAESIEAVPLAPELDALVTLASEDPPAITKGEVRAHLKERIKALACSFHARMTAPA